MPQTKILKTPSKPINPEMKKITNQDSQNALIIVLTVLITAIIVGGGIYLWQSSELSKTRKEIATLQQDWQVKLENLQAQFISLKENAEIALADQWQTFKINEFQFEFPKNWQANDIVKLGDPAEAYYEARDFLNENGGVVFTIECPIARLGYESGFEPYRQDNGRSYQANNNNYGVELWTWKDYQDEPVLIFMHRNDFANWRGEDNQDLNYSCKLYGMNSQDYQDVFEHIFATIEYTPAPVNLEITP